MSPLPNKPYQISNTILIVISLSHQTVWKVHSCRDYVFDLDQEHSLPVKNSRMVSSQKSSILWLLILVFRVGKLVIEVKELKLNQIIASSKICQKLMEE